MDHDPQLGNGQTVEMEVTERQTYCWTGLFATKRLIMPRNEVLIVSQNVMNAIKRRVIAAKVVQI